MVLDSRSLDGVRRNVRVCQAGKENLCNSPRFTGHTVDGGYAEYALGEESFVYPISDRFGDFEAAPLLCAGEVFPLREANRALHALKNDAIRGAAVLKIE